MTDNKVEVLFADGRVACFSYGVPVAARMPQAKPDGLRGLVSKAGWDLVAGQWICTEERYSAATTKHMNSWASPMNRIEVPDHLLRLLISPV
jgi:hypothetical protein